MVIYPVAYIVLSLPIAAGRMAMARGITPSPAYFCAAAAIITSSGVVDVTIYTLTRRKLIMDTEPSYCHTPDRFGIGIPRKHVHHLATITVEPDSNLAGRNISSSWSRNPLGEEAVLSGSSTDNIAHDMSEETPDLPQTYRFTEIEVTNERLCPSQTMPPTTPRMWGW